MTSAADEPRLAAGMEIAELLATMSASDSVELKVTVPPDEHRTTIASLAIDPVEAQPRQVFFFDTPDLRLNQAGVVVRARRIQGGRGDTVVKLRPVVPEELPPELRRSPSFNVEVDVLPGLIGVCSASLKGRASGDEIRDAVRGDTPLRKLFSKDQRAFYKQHAPADIDLDALQVLGPTFILKSRVPGDLDRPPIRRGGLVLPRWNPDPRAVDQMPAERGRDRGAPGPDVSRRPRHQRRSRHAADEDQDGPRVLRRPAARGRHQKVGRHRPWRGGCRRGWRGPARRTPTRTTSRFRSPTSTTTDTP